MGGCQAFTSRAFSVASELMLADFSGDTSRNKDPEAGSVKQQQGCGWQGPSSIVSMGTEGLDILLHTFYNLYSFPGKMIVMSQLSIALKMGRT